MKNTNKSKEESENRPRRRSSRNSNTGEGDIIPAKTTKIEDLKKMSDDIKNDIIITENVAPSVKNKKDVEVKKKPDNNVSEKRTAENLDRRVISFEEKESEDRNSANDLTEFQNTCTNIESKLSQINELKKEKNDAQNEEAITNYRIEASLLTANLKKLNRMTQIRGKIAKEKTQEVKKKVDGLHLDLQNLLYELMHVKKEIQKCMTFSSKDEEIDLVDVDKFYEEAPPSISQPELTKDNPHQQMLARLDWELKKRKELAAAKDTLSSQKKKTEAEINQKVDYLCNLKPRLEQIVKASRPVQEYMKIPLEAEALLQEKAQFLARPLYVLYIQAKAYKDVCDSNIDVDIKGDLLEAKTLFYQDFGNENIELSEASETETETEVEEAKGKGKREGRKHKRDKEKLTKHQTQLLKHHPLTVVLSVKEKDTFEVKLKFHHYPSLKINTVKIEVTMKGVYESHNRSPLLTASNILQDLLSSDNGKESPNTANTYQLQRLKMDSFESYISGIGIPYFWVQWVCGLNYLPNEDPTSSTPDASLSVKHFQNVVKKIRARLRSRLALQEQVLSLEKLMIPQPKEDSMKDAIPKRTVSILTSWRESTFEDFQMFNDRKVLEAIGLVNEDCLFYKATFTRNEAVDVMVVIHSDYPKEPPLILLSMKDGGVNKNSDLKILESELNSYVDELIEVGQPNHVLSNLLRRLQFCFDIYCETGVNDGTKERLYARKVRGRDRCRPYRFHPDGYYVQR